MEKKLPESIYFKSVDTTIQDVGEKGEVKFWFAVHGVQDGFKHIGNHGMFRKSINENGARIRHYKNHDYTIMPGVITELQDLAYGGSAVSKLILTTRDGLETYEQYKAMAEAGKSMEHSYHFDFINPTLQQAIDAYINDKELQLKEVKLWEVSTLTKPALNGLALTQQLKSFENLSADDLLKEKTFYDLLLKSKFEDVDLEKIEQIKNHLEALILSRKSTQQPEPLFPMFSFLNNQKK